MSKKKKESDFMKFQILYYTRFNKRLNVRVFFSYLDVLKFVSCNIDKIIGMNITRLDLENKCCDKL